MILTCIIGKAISEFLFLEELEFGSCYTPRTTMTINSAHDRQDYQGSGSFIFVTKIVIHVKEFVLDVT